eukprot:g11488.t1
MIWSPSPKKEAPNPDVQLSALEVDISLIDSSTVRKLFGVNEPSSDLSNTPQGTFALEEHPEANAGGKDRTPSALEQAARTAPVPAPALARKSRADLIAEHEDKKAVSRASLAWIEAVTAETCDAPKRAAALYAPDGVLWGTEVHAPDDPLWGTTSEEVRDTPERIYAYYDYFARLPKLRVSEYTPGAVRVHGDFASLAGNHTLAWRGTDGVTVQMRARFSLTFRRDHPERPDNAWMIVEHFSSSMPTAPAEFKQAAAAALTTAPSSPVVTTRGTTDATILDGSSSSMNDSVHRISSSSFAEYPAAVAKGSATAAQEIVDDLSEERYVRARQIADLQRRADRAESLAAQGAIIRASERLAGAKEDAELEERAVKAHRHAEELAEKATALAAELEALLAEERFENSTERPAAAGLESKPEEEEEQPESPETHPPEPAEKIVGAEESADTVNGGHSKVVRELINHHGIRGCVGAGGGIAAHEIAQEGHVDIMVMLSDAGFADMGRALTVAAKLGHEKAV